MEEERAKQAADGNREQLELLERWVPEAPTAHQGDSTIWAARLRAVLAERRETAAEIAEEALRSCPVDPQLLLLAALAALLTGLPGRALVYLKRFHKRYLPQRPSMLLTAIAAALQGKPGQARPLLREYGLASAWRATESFVWPHAVVPWLREQLLRIELEGPRKQVAAAKRAPKAAKPAPPRPSTSTAAAPLPQLPPIAATIDVDFDFGSLAALRLPNESGGAEAAWFRLRAELERLGLLQGFDELLCLAGLRGVETHPYQIETVRKVLKQFRGRVLLADEVGLGNTIEAGMVLREYMLRGMAERVLILAPAALVGQWRDEMSSKFGIDCATSHDALLRQDARAFWAQPRVIASIAAARRKDHAELLAGMTYDVVVVDEAHHLRDPASAGYRLVDRLQKRFLLLLSATPVQNSLLELYHLLTLLQPGIFKTQREFRTAYMLPGKPREPLNADRRRDLMRSVMVRNTRAVAGLRLPRRHAATLRAQPSDVEAACYREMTTLARELAGDERHRLSLQHLLGAAGSSPAAAAAALARFVDRHARDPRWTGLRERYRAIAAGTKEASLLTLLERNADEKKLIFAHHRHSLVHLAELL